MSYPYSPFTGALRKLSHVQEDIQRVRHQRPHLAEVADNLLGFIVRDLATLQDWMDQPRDSVPYYFASGVEWLDYISTQMEALNYLYLVLFNYRAGDDLVNDTIHTQLPEIREMLTQQEKPPG